MTLLEERPAAAPGPERRGHAQSNIITTMLCLRSPGMTMFRMSIFTWNMFIVSAMVILAFWTFLNLLSSVGAGVLAVSTLILLWNLWITPPRGAPAGDDPWGGDSLEWAPSSPPPKQNSHSLPLIRSERPAFDARRMARAGR